VRPPSPPVVVPPGSFGASEALRPQVCDRRQLVVAQRLGDASNLRDVRDVQGLSQLHLVMPDERRTGVTPRGGRGHWSLPRLAALAARPPPISSRTAGSLAPSARTTPAPQRSGGVRCVKSVRAAPGTRTIPAAQTREWRNGRRAGLRIRCPQGRGGSTPPSRTRSSGDTLLATGDTKAERSPQRMAT
jgi:hypothetical protein